MGSRFTGDTRDPAVNVTNLVVMVTFILAICARLGTKYRLFRRLTNDDYFILVSLVFGVIQSIAISMSVANGYGKHFREVSSSEFVKIQKWLYTASLLYIASLWFSKLSLAAFIRNLTPSTRHRILARIVEIVTSVWAVIAFLGTAFQCKIPQTWNLYYGKCLNKAAWWYFVGISNIATDVLILSQGLHLIHQVQTSFKKRLIFASIFIPRVFVTLGIIGELALIHDATHTNDPTYDLCEITITEQIIQCVSIVTACWGQLKPFLTWLQSNGLRIQNADFANGYGYKSSSGSHSQFRSRDRRHDVQRASPSDQNEIVVTQDWEVGSQSSRVPVLRDAERDYRVEAEASGTRRSSDVIL